MAQNVPEDQDVADCGATQLWFPGRELFYKERLKGAARRTEGILGHHQDMEYQRNGDGVGKNGGRMQ